jgi:hypothetical protein
MFCLVVISVFMSDLNMMPVTRRKKQSSFHLNLMSSRIDAQSNTGKPTSGHTGMGCACNHEA